MNEGISQMKEELKKMEKRDEENKSEVRKIVDNLRRSEEKGKKEEDEEEEDTEEKGKDERGKKTGRSEELDRAKKMME